MSSISSCIMILGSRKGKDIMYPGPPLLSREKNRVNPYLLRKCTFCLVVIQTETQDMGQRVLCTLGPPHAHRHHSLWSLMSYGGWSPGSSAPSFQSGSCLGSSCRKGSHLLILIFMSSAKVLIPKDILEEHQLNGTLCKDLDASFNKNICKYLWLRWEEDFKWTIIWIHV